VHILPATLGHDLAEEVAPGRYVGVAMVNLRVPQAQPDV
jgi:hypothetical protein